MTFEIGVVGHLRAEPGDEIEQVLEVLLEHLYKSDAIDPDLTFTKTGDLSGMLEITMGVDAPTLFDAVNMASVFARTAAHVAGIRTREWPDAHVIAGMIEVEWRSLNSMNTIDTLADDDLIEA